MAEYGIIPSRRWRNTDGRTASLYGAVPYARDALAEGWSVEESGFTVENLRTGTVGIGRQPFATFGEAQAWVAAHEARMAKARAAMAEGAADAR